MTKKQTIGMASDHAGYELKEQLKPFLKELGYKIKDFGAHSAESMDYADTAHPLAEAVEKGQVDFGIAMCGSGNGISMTLNKHQGYVTPSAGFLRSQLSPSSTTMPTSSPCPPVSSAKSWQGRSYWPT